MNFDNFFIPKPYSLLFGGVQIKQRIRMCVEVFFFRQETVGIKQVKTGVLIELVIQLGKECVQSSFQRQFVGLIYMILPSWGDCCNLPLSSRTAKPQHVKLMTLDKFDERATGSIFHLGLSFCHRLSNALSNAINCDREALALTSHTLSSDIVDGLVFILSAA